MTADLAKCAMLEADPSAVSLDAAAECYMRVALAQPRSSAAVCGILRMRRRWLDALAVDTQVLGSQQAARNEQVRVWMTRSQLMREASDAGGGGAGRCAAAFVDAAVLHQLLQASSADDGAGSAQASRDAPDFRADDGARVGSMTRSRDRRAAAVRLTEQGRGLAASGQLQEAAARLQEAVQADAGYADAYLWWGLCESHLGRPEAATRLLTTALHASGTAELAATASFELGNLAFHGGRLEEAKAHYQRALAKQPSYAEARSNLGVLAYSARAYAEASHAFERAIDLSPAFADAYQHLGAALKAQGDTNRAQEAYVSASRLAPEAAEPRRGVALVLRERGHLEQALEWLGAARLLEPRNPQVRVRGER